jgi:predicted RNA-binding protein
VELELLLYPLLELGTLLEGQAVALGNDRDDIDKLTELLQHNNVDGLQRVAGGLDEKQAAVDTGILEVALTLGGELLAEVGAVLVLDVLDDGVPAALVVDQVAVAGRVDDVQTQTHAILLDDVGHRVDGRGGARLFVGLEATLAVHQVRREDGVDERRLSETGLACHWVSCVRHAYCGRSLPTQMTLNWKPRLTLFFSICLVMLSKPT